MDEEYAAFLPLVVVVMLGFTLLLPGSLGFYLFRHRKRLYTPQVQLFMGWLFNPFHKGAEAW